MHIIPLSRSASRLESVFFAQQEHHRNRRLQFEQSRAVESLESTTTTSSRHPRHWRRRHLQTELELSNCHLILWSTTIGLGTPPQEFLVDINTASSDTWVASAKCQDTCAAFPDWRKFDQHASDTYEIADDHADRNAFAVEYEDGEQVYGVHARDVLQLGAGLKVENFVFAQVTSLYDFTTCEAEEGVLGLAFSNTTSQGGFPSLIQRLGSTLEHGMYSLYLSPLDDYPEIDNPFLAMDEYGNIEYGGQSPLRHSSQLVLGGVDQRHYVGCLEWHDIVGEAEGGSSQTFWDVLLDDVQLGGTSVLTSTNSTTPTNLALIDSGSSYLVGPPSSVAKIVTMNHATCFNLEPGSSESTEVDCQMGVFDAAIVECDAPFFNLEFMLNGHVYVLEKEDLVMGVTTSFGDTCVLRVVASEGSPGWVLGDVFLNKYYAAFDFRNRRVGLAMASQNAQDICDQDLPMSLTREPTLAPTRRPTAAPTLTPVSLPTHDHVPDSMGPDPMPTALASHQGGGGGGQPPHRSPTADADFDFDNQGVLGNAKSATMNDESSGIWALGVAAAVVALVVLLVCRNRRRRVQAIELALEREELDAMYRNELAQEASTIYRDRRADPDGDESFILRNHDFVLDQETLQRMN